MTTTAAVPIVHSNSPAKTTIPCMSQRRRVAEIIDHPRVAGGPIPSKVREGARCNGCGLCCALQLCDLAREFLDAAAAPCPAMEFAEGRFWCGLARRPGRYLGVPAFADRFIRPMVLRALAIGDGCDTSD